jgi:two-component system LytT family sensor kinase
MKNIIKNPSDINKIEFWAATSIFVFSVFFLVSSSVTNQWRPERFRFEGVYQQYSYFSNYFLPTLIRYATFYCSYLFLTSVIVPQVSQKRNLTLNIIVTITLFGLIWVILAISDTWLKGYRFSNRTEEEVYAELFSEAAIYSSWLLMMFSIYTCIKLLAIYLLENSELIQAKYRVITRDGIYAFILWMIGLFLLLISRSATSVILIIASCSLTGILLYCYSLYALLPMAFKQNKPFRSYLKIFFRTVIFSTLPLFLILLSLVPSHETEIAFLTTFFNIFFQPLFTAPIAWYVYKHRITVDYEIKGLQSALGRSTADLNFLRSQINPHFLFNVLNTLYGTALQENAERTSEGIQKLGDMMRFMLHENLQEKISLIREIEYLNNYIDLQTLRTQSSPDIQISTEIENYSGVLQIGPMLLIPFIENAFKHGISLKEPSYIRVSLLTKGKTLYFDISNSIHPKTTQDPEQNNNGIGMNNVKQRLRLLYPNRHELTIRESGKEYFVHLTIELD